MKRVIFQILTLIAIGLATFIPSLAQVPQVRLNISSSDRNAKERIVASLKKEFLSKDIEIITKLNHMLIDVSSVTRRCKEKDAASRNAQRKMWYLDVFVNPIQFKNRPEILGYAVSVCLLRADDLVYHILLADSDIEQISSALIEWLEVDGVFKEMKGSASLKLR